MRTIATATITETIARMFQQANTVLPQDVRRALGKAAQAEKSPRALKVLGQMLDNAQVAQDRRIALCQDTGIAEVYLKIGQDVHLEGESVQDAVNNTPAPLSVTLVPGDRVEITILPKGGGTENASMLRMFPPSAGWSGIMGFVLETVREKGINACPPLVVGVGIGGTFATVCGLAKKGLFRQIGSTPAEPIYAAREKELLDAVNALDLGPMGLGGRTTALAVHIEHAPCHIACLPAAVAMHCHSLRRLSETL
jgi:fumarate hydratase subunit alpha